MSSSPAINNTFAFIFDNSFKSFDYKKISFKSLSTSDIIDFYKKSRVILDINHPDQVGLTMRTFEAIGANKKIITTNEQIKNYNFYNPINILIINRNSIQLNEEFFKTPYQKIEKDIYYNLSLDGWVKEIFNINKNNDWLIKDHYNYIILGKPMLALIPGICIMSLVMAFMLLGNKLRDKLDVKN